MAAQAARLGHIHTYMLHVACRLFGLIGFKFKCKVHLIAPTGKPIEAKGQWHVKT